MAIYDQSPTFSVEDRVRYYRTFGSILSQFGHVGKSIFSITEGLPQSGGTGPCIALASSMQAVVACNATALRVCTLVLFIMYIICATSVTVTANTN